ncbi:hypothetical protein Tco_1064842, partial [Tanacetum coccineum]
MNPIAAQQVALDNALVAPGDRVKIGKCNMRIIRTIKKKEPTYQVVSDALALSPLYLAFLSQLKVDVEVIRDILQICPRLSNQEFVEPPSLDEEIASFIKELGYKGDIESITEKKPLVAVKEPAEKPAKKPVVRRHSVEKGYQKKQTRNNIHQAGGSSEGACLESEVPDELKGKSIDTNSDDSNDDDDQQSDDEQTVSDNPRISDDEEEIQEDEYVQTPEDYVPTDDETNDVDDVQSL